MSLETPAPETDYAVKTARAVIALHLDPARDLRIAELEAELAERQVHIDELEKEGEELNNRIYEVDHDWYIRWDALKCEKNNRIAELEEENQELLQTCEFCNGHCPATQPRLVSTRCGHLLHRRCLTTAYKVRMDAVMEGKTNVGINDLNTCPVCNNQM